MYFNWADTQLLLLVEHSMQRREYNESLRLLAKAPDFGLFPHVPEAKILPLVVGWDIYDLVHIIQQLICQVLFAFGRMREAMDFLHVNDNRLNEQNEARKADLGWLDSPRFDCKTSYCLFDSAEFWSS